MDNSHLNLRIDVPPPMSLKSVPPTCALWPLGRPLGPFGPWAGPLSPWPLGRPLEPFGPWAGPLSPWPLGRPLEPVALEPFGLVYFSLSKNNI